MQVSTRSRVGNRSDWADGIDVVAPRQARRAETGIEVKEVRIIKKSNRTNRKKSHQKKEIGKRGQAEQRWAIRGQGAWVERSSVPSVPVQCNKIKNAEDVNDETRNKAVLLLDLSRPSDRFAARCECGSCRWA